LDFSVNACACFLAFAASVLFPISALLFSQSHQVMGIAIRCVGNAGTVLLAIFGSATVTPFSITGKTNAGAQSHRYRKYHNTRHYSFHLFLLFVFVSFKIF